MKIETYLCNFCGRSIWPHVVGKSMPVYKNDLEYMGKACDKKGRVSDVAMHMSAMHICDNCINPPGQKGDTDGVESGQISEDTGSDTGGSTV